MQQGEIPTIGLGFALKRREQHYAYRKTGAVLSFVRSLVRDAACVDPKEVEFPRNIGFSEEEIVEVVVNVGHNISANYFNLVAQPGIDLSKSTA